MFSYYPLNSPHTVQELCSAGPQAARLPPCDDKGEFHWPLAAGEMGVVRSKRLFASELPCFLASISDPISPSQNKMHHDSRNYTEAWPAKPRLCNSSEA
jgi:hypothetical protein